MIYRGIDYKVVAKKLIMLKHKEFKPQIAAAMETKLQQGVLNQIHDTINSNANVKGMLNIALANTLDVNLSKGRVANIPNGWRSERFSFILMVEVYAEGILRSEEIYQGYTDRVESVGGRLEAGGSITIAPDTMMYVNRVMEIIYSQHSDGRLIPSFSKSDSILADNNNLNLLGYNSQDSNLKVVRPLDLVHKYHVNAIENDFDGALTVTMSDNFDKIGKFSKSDNEVGGRTISKLVTAANRSKLDKAYNFDSGPTSQFENMMSELVENNSSNYKLLYKMGIENSVSQLSRWTVADLSKQFPTLTPMFFTVESYNDIITKQTNQAFNFSGTNDLGDDVLSDNQLTRFQKRIVPYLFDAMLSYGFIQFSGTMTNKTIDGSVAVNHSLLLNVSDTVNSNPEVRAHVMRLLYAKLTDMETRNILSNEGTQSVELVFDLSLSDSNIFINLNNRTLKVKIPTLCDSASTSLVMDSNSSKDLVTELKTVVDSVLGEVTSSSVLGSPLSW